MISNECCIIVRCAFQFTDSIVLLGLGSIKSKKNYNPLNHKDSFTYIVRYDEAISLLKEIEPYLVIEQKKLRAQLILSEYKKLTPRNVRYSEELLKKKEEFPIRFMSI